MTTKADKKLFYSWQSDSDERVNKLFQRDVLKMALKGLKKSDPELAARLLQDTTGTTGTPEIAGTIFDRIDDSFCVASDISIINPDSDERKTPNPNVLLELGYAAKSIGWDRIITFFNSHYGKVEDLPFNIRGRRPTVRYELAPNVSDEELQKSATHLAQSLQRQIKDILALKGPVVLSPSSETKDVRLRRERDVKNLKTVLSYVSTMAIERHAKFFRESEVIHYDIFTYATYLESFITSSRFHLYDTKLKELLSKLTEALGKTLSYGQFFSWHDGHLYKFIRGDWYQNDEDEKAATQLHKEMLELDDVLKEFTTYVNEHYLEIDLTKLNRVAVRRQQKEEEEIESRIRGSKKSKSKIKKK